MSVEDNFKPQKSIKKDHNERSQNEWKFESSIKVSEKPPSYQKVSNPITTGQVDNIQTGIRPVVIPAL
jgi:hypothetical protein